MSNFHTFTKSEIEKEFSTGKNGLNDEQIKINKHKYGNNELPTEKKQSFLKKFFLQFKDWMIIVLLFAALASFILYFVSDQGDLVDSIIIVSIVIFNAIMGVIQEQKAENALESLKKMSQNHATIMRNGQIKKIPVNEVVVGDKVFFEAGDIICADLFLIETASLKMNESALTGESRSVDKHYVEKLDEKTALGDRINIAYSGSNVLYGRGVGIVVAVGQNTEIGKIAQMLKTGKEEQTPLQKNLANLGKVITIAVLAIAVLIFLLDVLISGKSFLDSFMTAIAIAVSAIPESLPIVVTIIMAIGVTKMSKKNAIVKKLHAVETLGACEIICSDKTGTLTQNQMQVKKAFYNNNFGVVRKENRSLTENLLINCMVLCNNASLSENKSSGDPTETALIDYALSLDANKNIFENQFIRLSEVPFDSERKLMTTVNQNGKIQEVYSKGAPDKLIAKCKNILINDEIVPLTNQHKMEIENAIKGMGEDALRVLAFAYKNVDNIKTNTLENNLTFIGMVGMADPARPQAKNAVQTCKNAGMTPIMITGDHANTALAIAKELGIASGSNQVLLGQELDEMSDEEFLKKIKDIRVYARVSPQNKVRIVQGWKSLGKIVAMTGDGVNDAPSLKTAHIGIGMGITGTDVTKDVADVVLADDNFATIIYAVEEGRKIFANIQKTIQFLFSTNMTEVIALVLATLLFPHSTFLLPIQILFINLITDSLPAIALGFEEKECDIMKHKPRKIDDSIFSGGIAKKIIYQSILQVIICMSVFIVANICYNQIVANTMAFLTINIVQIFHMFNVRTSKSVFTSPPFKNKWLVIAFVVGIGLTLLVALVPFLASAFKLTALTLEQWLIVLVASLSIIPIVEIGKFIDNHITKE